MTRVGVSERKLEGKFANRQQEQIRGDLLGERARRKQERWRKGGGEKFMSMRPDDPETGEVQAHKNALCTPQLPSLLPLSVSFPRSLSHFTSLHHCAGGWRLTAL